MDSTVSATLDAMTSALPRLSALQDPIRVVIADDHGGFVRAITTTLERAGIWVVAIAATGQGALDAIRTERPAIALVDMRMPGLSGIDVCDQRAATRTRDARGDPLRLRRERDHRERNQRGSVRLRQQGQLTKHHRGCDLELRRGRTEPSLDAPRGAPTLARRASTSGITERAGLRESGTVGSP